MLSQRLCTKQSRNVLARKKNDIMSARSFATNPCSWVGPFASLGFIHVFTPFSWGCLMQMWHVSSPLDGSHRASASLELERIPSLHCLHVWVFSDLCIRADVVLSKLNLFSHTCYQSLQASCNVKLGERSLDRASVIRG